MDAEALAFTPAVAAAELIRTKQLSPVEYLQELLQRIERLEPRVNAFVHLDAGPAMEAAKRAEAALMRGDRIGRLHGVPVTIKDLADTKSMPTQHGTKIFAGHQPTEDTPFVTRLQDAGAIVIGKTTTSEFGWTGVSRQPTDRHHPQSVEARLQRRGVVGRRRSGGGGGVRPLHQGSDGAGSIRMPSHFCGVFGLKPSFGRVPVLSGLDRRLHLA